MNSLKIKFEKNEFDFLVAYRNDKPLCSQRNPMQEADKWVSRIDLEGIEKCYVIGLGGGYHIKNLLAKKSSLKVRVIEFDIELIENFKHSQSHNDHLEIINWNLTEDKKRVLKESFYQKNSIFEFRPSWAHRDHEFVDVSHYLTGRTKESIDFYQKEVGSLFLETRDLPKEHILTVKDLIETQSILNDEVEKKWKVIRELIR
jgi:hypothetical protein